jgi:hypothetical protein
VALRTRWRLVIRRTSPRFPSCLRPDDSGLTPARPGSQHGGPGSVHGAANLAGSKQGRHRHGPSQVEARCQGQCRQEELARAPLLATASHRQPGSACLVNFDVRAHCCQLYSYNVPERRAKRT